MSQKVSMCFVRESASGRKPKAARFCTLELRWKGGQLGAEYRKPFDMLAVAIAAQKAGGEVVAQEIAQNENWLPGMDSNHDSRLQRPLSYH